MILIIIRCLIILPNSDGGGAKAINAMETGEFVGFPLDLAVAPLLVGLACDLPCPKHMALPLIPMLMLT